jgi:hypothetical protein
MNEEIAVYHKNNYKKVQSEEFECSIDYLSQRTKITIAALENTVSISWENEALVIEHLLYVVEKFLKKKSNINIKSSLVKYLNTLLSE